MLGSYPRTKSMMEERRKRAEEVQATSAGRTPQEQLARLDAAKLVATKERLKLAMRIKRAQEEANKPKKK